MIVCRLPSALLRASRRGGFTAPRRLPATRLAGRVPPRQARRDLHLTPRERDHLLLHDAGRLAQRRLARGLRLNVPEARALIAAQVSELVRNGARPTVVDAAGTTVTRAGTVGELMAVGTRLLGRNQVLPGVAALVREVQVEATFPDGTKLVTVHEPISREDGDLALALEGSFFPVPDLAAFRGEEDEGDAGAAVPGEVLVSSTLPPIEINAVPEAAAASSLGPHLIEVAVTNTGDRPIQVGSHYRELFRYFGLVLPCPLLLV